MEWENTKYKTINKNKGISKNIYNTDEEENLGCKEEEFDNECLFWYTNNIYIFSLLFSMCFSPPFNKTLVFMYQIIVHFCKLLFSFSLQCLHNYLQN